MEEEIQEFILSFQRRFCDRFGTVPRVKYTISNKYQIPDMKIGDLEKIADKIVFSHRKLKYIKGIRTKKRYRPLVLIRQCMFMIAREQNYSLAFIGEYFGGFNHTTVLYSANTFKKLLETKNLEAIETFNKFEDAIKNKFGHDGNVQYDL